jgi:hypothetical protein
MLPAAAVPASRITVVPIKPGTKDAILEVANSADFKSGLEGEAFSGLIEVSVIVTEDKLVSRSLYTTMDSLTGSDDAQMKLMGAMKEHFAGAPERTTGMVDWTFAGTAAKPSGKKFVTEHVEPFWFSRLLVDSPGTCTRPAHTGTE